MDSVGVHKGVRYRIRKIIGRFTGNYKSFILNVNRTNYNKRCLLVYITIPFTVRKINDAHQNQSQVVEMARVIGEFSYNVDVADYQDMETLSRIKYKYNLIIYISIRVKPGFWSDKMNEDCKIVYYATGSSSTFAYENESKRLADLEKRRGVKLSHRRSSDVNIEQQKQIENVDAVWFIGNQYNLHSFDYLKMPPVYFIKNTGYDFSWLRKDIVRSKNNFLFFASSGQVHKGLDLLLEVFSKKDFPCNLYICSSFIAESDFCQVYHHELYECQNIFPVGFVNIHGPTFRAITEKCAFVIMPSCSEARAGSILTVMSAGLIPIVSLACGYDNDEAINLPDCEISTIEQYIREYSQKSDEWIRKRSEQCVNIARTRYSFESFTQSVRDAMSATLNEKHE